MHSSSVLSSLLVVAAVAFAAPAGPSSSSSSTSYGAASYTADASLAPAASAYKSGASSPAATSSKSASTVPTASYAGKPTQTGSAQGSADADLNLPPVVKYNTRAGDEALIAKLLTAPTQGDRNRLLDQPGDYVFDFNESPEGSESTGRGGRTAAASAKTFPALIGNHGAMTLGFLGPCAMNTPHTHPRSAELNIVVEGRLVTNFVQENNTPFRSNILSKYQMTVFPQGALHQEFNPDCEDAVFVAGFASDDPGVQQAAQSFFGLRSDVVAATLGGVEAINGADLDSFRDLIPANVALGVEACLKKCGIQKNAKRDLSEILGA